MSKRVSTTVSPIVSDMINDMLKTGLYGRTRSDVVREAVHKFVRDAREVLATIRKRGGR